MSTPVTSRALPVLLVLALCGGCASRRQGYDKTLRECSRSGDAGRRIERHGAIDFYGGLDASSAGLSKSEVTEIRDDCVTTVKVRTGARSWEVSSLSFVGKYAASKHGDRVAFTAQAHDGWHVIVDGVQSPPFDGTSRDAIFSADGQHVMFVGYDEGRGGRVFVDDREVALAPFGIDHGACSFTSDGRYLIAIRSEEGGLRVSAGGVLGPLLDSSTKGPKIVASSTHLDLTTSSSGGRFAYVGRRGDRGVLVVDGRELPVPEGLLPLRPLFSATGARFLYRAVPATGADPKTNPPAVVIDGVLHRMPGLTGAAFARGEIPLVTTSLPLGMGSSVGATHLFGVDRLDQRKPAGEPDDRIILEDRTMDPQDIDVLVDGTVTHRGQPFAHLRGKRAPTRAE